MVTDGDGAQGQTGVLHRAEVGSRTGSQYR
jgi:hypothetical protein